MDSLTIKLTHHRLWIRYHIQCAEHCELVAKYALSAFVRKVDALIAMMPHCYDDVSKELHKLRLQICTEFDAMAKQYVQHRRHLMYSVPTKYSKRCNPGTVRFLNCQRRRLYFAAAKWNRKLDHLRSSCLDDGNNVVDLNRWMNKLKVPFKTLTASPHNHSNNHSSPGYGSHGTPRSHTVQNEAMDLNHLESQQNGRNLTQHDRNHREEPGDMKENDTNHMEREGNREEIEHGMTSMVEGSDSNGMMNGNGNGMNGMMNKMSDLEVAPFDNPHHQQRQESTSKEAMASTTSDSDTISEGQPQHSGPIPMSQQVTEEKVEDATHCGNGGKLKKKRPSHMSPEHRKIRETTFMVDFQCMFEDAVPSHLIHRWSNVPVDGDCETKSEEMWADPMANPISMTDGHRHCDYETAHKSAPGFGSGFDSESGMGSVTGGTRGRRGTSTPMDPFESGSKGNGLGIRNVMNDMNSIHAMNGNGMMNGSTFRTLHCPSLHDVDVDHLKRESLFLASACPQISGVGAQHSHYAHLNLPQCKNSTVIPIFINEPSSIIAYTLSSLEYHCQMSNIPVTEVMKCRDTGRPSVPELEKRCVKNVENGF